MGVVLFRHARVCVAKLIGDDDHRHSAHGECGTMRMAQHMKRDRRFDFRALAGIYRRAQLM